MLPNTHLINTFAPDDRFKLSALAGNPTDLNKLSSKNA